MTALYNLEYDIAITHLNECIRIYEYLNLEEELGNPYYYISMCYFDSTETISDVYISYMEKAAKIYEAYENTRGLAHAYFNLAHNYIQSGDLIKANKYLEKSRILLPNVKDENFKIWLNITEALFLYQSNEISQVVDKLQENLQLLTTIDNPIILAENLFDLIIVYLREKEILKAELYYKELKKIRERFDNKRIEFYVFLIHGWLLALGNQMADKVKAQDILTDILENDVYNNFRGWSFVHIQTNVVSVLLSLYLEEYRLFNNSNKLKDALELLEKYLNRKIAWDSDYIEIMVLKAKILAKQGNKDEALEILVKLKNILKEKQIPRLKEGIEEVLEEINLSITGELDESLQEINSSDFEIPDQNQKLRKKTLFMRGVKLLRVEELEDYFN